MKKFEVYAHQGGSFPPNSFYAFGVAERTGANGIETDVCLTTDGKAIIHHPGTLNPDPADLTWARINEFYPHIPTWMPFLYSYIITGSLNASWI